MRLRSHHFTSRVMRRVVQLQSIKQCGFTALAPAGNRGCPLGNRCYFPSSLSLPPPAGRSPMGKLWHTTPLKHVKQLRSALAPSRHAKLCVAGRGGTDRLRWACTNHHHKPGSNREWLKIGQAARPTGQAFHPPPAALRLFHRLQSALWIPYGRQPADREKHGM